MDFWLQTIGVLSGSMTVVFFLLTHIIGWKKEKIDKYSIGDEIEVVDDDTDLSNAVSFSFGENKRYYRKSEE